MKSKFKAVKWVLGLGTAILVAGSQAFGAEVQQQINLARQLKFQISSTSNTLGFVQNSKEELTAQGRSEVLQAFGTLFSLESRFPECDLVQTMVICDEGRQVIYVTSNALNVVITQKNGVSKKITIPFLTEAEFTQTYKKMARMSIQDQRKALKQFASHCYTNLGLLCAPVATALGGISHFAIRGKMGSVVPSQGISSESSKSLAAHRN